MKIVRSRVHVVDLPISFDPEVTGTLGTHIVLRLLADNGLEGISFGRVARERVRQVFDTVEQLVDRLGRFDAHDVERIAVVRDTRFEPDQGLYVRNDAGRAELRAASLIDIALWDLKAKVAEMPLYRLLGGYRSNVPCYASWGVEPGPPDDELAGRAQMLLGRGYRSMKFHVRGMDADATTHHLATLREAVGPDVELMVDAHRRWNAKQAIDVVRRLEEHRPYWIEDPVDPSGSGPARFVRESLETLVCTGETLATPADFARLMAGEAADVVMVDFDVGGITALVKVAHMAEAFGLPVTPHLSSEIAAQVVGAVPNGLTVEHVPWLDPVFVEPLELVDGHLSLTERPGLGLELDERALADLKSEW